MNTSAIIDSLMNSMSFTQKVGQLNQRLLGWKSVERHNGRLRVTDTLKEEIDRWGGLGVLYGLFRADPWSGRHWGNGILPQERPEAIALVQEAVRSRGAQGIGALLSEEAPHGHQALGGTVLPTNLALGATFDVETVREAERAVGAELAASGVHLALVSGLDIARDPRWGRCEECFGEDPLMASRMCAAIVEGMQGEQRSLIGHGGVAVVLKHLAAQGEAVGGRNGQSAIIGHHDLHEIHLPPVVEGVRAGAIGFMAAYNDIDSMPCCANPWLLKDYLRDELGFDGIVMADGLAVDRLESMAGSIPAAGRAALLAGVDVSLWDEGFASLERYADDETVVAAVDRSLRRVLELKSMFGLLPDSPTAAESSAEEPSDGEAAHDGPVNVGGRPRIYAADAGAIDDAMRRTDELSRRLAGECLTLLSGEDVLRSAGETLRDRQAGAVIVTGPFADDIACFLGDYTAPLPEAMRKGVASVLGDEIIAHRVLVAADPADVSENDWKRASMVVAVVGGTSERSYDSAFADNGAAASVVGRGATCGEGVDLSDISLPWGQDALLGAVRALTNAPIIGVAVCGRAHVLRGMTEACDAVVWAGYAGPYGPHAVVEALMGESLLPGRLPVTLPSHPGAVPVRYNDRQSAEHVYRDAESPVLFPFSHGIGALRGVDVCDVEVGSEGGSVVIRVRLCCGDSPACGSLNVFARTVGGGTRVPRLARLVDSRYCRLSAGQTMTLRFDVPMDRLAGSNASDARVEIWVGGDVDHRCEIVAGRL